MQQASLSSAAMTLPPCIQRSAPEDDTKPAEPTTSGIDLIAQINQQLYSQQLGLQSNSGFVPVPVSLTPWQLAPAQFAMAQQLARLLGQIQSSAAANPQWLLPLLEGLQLSHTVPGQIWRTLRGIYLDETDLPTVTTKHTNHNLMLNRHDFLLDQQQQWKWVESNPIAAGMGPLNDRYLAVMQTQDLQQQHLSYAPNDAITTQAKLLAEAAFASALQVEITRCGEPLMLIVVEADEDNIFDQQLLCDEVRRLGVRVERVTIKDLIGCEFDGSEHLRWQTQRVDLIYWRTGYNPSADLTDAFWQFRARLEQAPVMQCPNLAGQLTGSKWFQHQFTALLLADPQQVCEHFGIDAKELAVLKEAVVPSYAVNELKTETAEALIAQGFWYKTQQEGGGNVARGPAASDKLTHTDSADLLMAPINAVVRQETLTSLRHGTAAVTTEHISELGIFSVGEQAVYGGYLCRTKPAKNNEGGVHRGGAVLDVIKLVS